MVIVLSSHGNVISFDLHAKKCIPALFSRVCIKIDLWFVRFGFLLVNGRLNQLGSEERSLLFNMPAHLRTAFPIRTSTMGKMGVLIKRDKEE